MCYLVTMQRETETITDDYSPVGEDLPETAPRFVEGSPECIELLKRAGSALVDGDFTAAQGYTNQLWATNADIPEEIAPSLEIKSDEPYRLRAGNIPPELHYWLQHPDNRLRHNMEARSGENGGLHILWQGPHIEGLMRGVAGYVLGECTDASGEVDWGKVDEILPSVYEGDFSKVPKLAGYQLDKHEAALVFTPGGEDELFSNRISELMETVSKMKPLGEVGFTFSIDEDDTGNSGVLSDVEVFSASINGSVDLSDGPAELPSVGHTHPNITPFSAQDIHVIKTRYPDIPHMVIVGNNRGYLYLPDKGMSIVELVLEESQ